MVGGSKQNWGENFRICSARESVKQGLYLCERIFRCQRRRNQEKRQDALVGVCSFLFLEFWELSKKSLPPIRNTSEMLSPSSTMPFSFLTFVGVWNILFFSLPAAPSVRPYLTKHKRNGEGKNRNGVVSSEKGKGTRSQTGRNLGRRRATLQVESFPF